MGQRYVVEERTAPISFGASFLIGLLTAIEVVAFGLLVLNIVNGVGDTALAVNLAVVLGLFVMTLAIYRSSFVPKLASIEPEETGPGAGG
jgi:hypothetical protein